MKLDARRSLFLFPTCNIGLETPLGKQKIVLEPEAQKWECLPANLSHLECGQGWSMVFCPSKIEVLFSFFVPPDGWCNALLWHYLSESWSGGFIVEKSSVARTTKSPLFLWSEAEHQLTNNCRCRRHQGFQSDRIASIISTFQDIKRKIFPNSRLVTHHTRASLILKFGRMWQSRHWSGLSHAARMFRCKMFSFSNCLKRRLLSGPRPTCKR